MVIPLILNSNAMETQNYRKVILRIFFEKSILVISFMIILLCKAECQNSQMPASTFRGGSYEQTFSTVRIGLAQSVMVAPKGEFHLVVLHRFYEISSDVNEFFGMDHAYTRLGFDYGIFNWLSATIGRSMSAENYEFALKAVMLKQNENDMPVSLSWYGSALEYTGLVPDTLGHNSFGGRLSFVNQLNIARNQGILSFQVSPLWLHVNNYIKNGIVVNSGLNILAVDLSSRVRLTEMLGIIAEYIPIVTNEEFSWTNPFTIGLDINTGKHQFQLIFSNSQGTDEKTVLTQTEGSWSNRIIYFGFNLTRVFNSKMD
jgi:hypothetical protein